MNAVSITLFQGIWNAIAVPIQSAEQPMMAALQGYVTSWFALAVGAYLMAILLMAAFAPSEEDATLLFRKALLAGIVWSIAATATGSNTWVIGLINGAINGISTAIAGAFGVAGATTASTFDTMATQLFAIGLAVIEQVPAAAIVRGFIIGLIVDVYIVVSMLAVGIMFVIYLSSSVMLGFLLGFSPFFVTLYMFPFTRQFFDGWVRTVVAAALTQVFVIAVLLLLTVTIDVLLLGLAIGLHGGGTLSQAGGDIASALYVVTVAGAMVLIFAYLAIHASRLAQSIAGGAHAQFSRISTPFGGSGSRSGGGSGGGSAGGGLGGSQPVPRSYSFSRSVGSAS